MKKKQDTTLDWHRADIVAELKKAGWSVRSLSINSKLAPNTLAKALDGPYLKGERIIAAAIGVPAEEIWPSRFEKRNFRPTFPNAIMNAYFAK